MAAMNFQKHAQLGEGLMSYLIGVFLEENCS